MGGYVTHVDDVAAVAQDGSSVRTTIDSSTGAELLEQKVVTLPAGQTATRTTDGRDEVAYIVSGHGSLTLDSEVHDLRPDIGVYLQAGETYDIVNSGPDAMTIVSVTAPPPGDDTEVKPRKVIVDTEDQPVIPAGKDREFKFVVNPDAGCAEVTQFVGWIPPGRAPTHYHLYDEVMYILDGEGVLHLAGHPDTPIRAGSVIHLPPPVEHCVENTGDRLLRVLGVFHPAGSAAEAYEDTD
jgi:mannose-6-phosphate isomerase-like protein (cupin superfamily)